MTTIGVTKTFPSTVPEKLGDVVGDVASFLNPALFSASKFVALSCDWYAIV